MCMNEETRCAVVVICILVCYVYDFGNPCVWDLFGVLNVQWDQVQWDMF